MNPPVENSLAENLARLEEAVAAACRAAGRSRAEVELMAVSKTFPAAAIAEGAALGLTLFGENRVQEFAGKEPELARLRDRTDGPIRVHLIGHLQTNKAARAAELFDGALGERREMSFEPAIETNVGFVFRNFAGFDGHEEGRLLFW